MLNSSHWNGHTLEFPFCDRQTLGLHPQTQMLEPPCTA